MSNTWSRLKAAIFLLILLQGVLDAQVYQTIFVPRQATDQASSRMPCTNDAGNILNFGNFIGFSNDRAGDTIFLCLGDSIFANHDALSVDFSGDPIPATPAGIGYVPFSCPPTVTGPMITDLPSDPCLLTSVILPPPDSVPFHIFVGTQGLSGSSWFWNDGSVQTFFSTMGSNEPRVIWQTPITFDRLNTVGGFSFAAYERDASNVFGPCVNLSIDQAFAIAYLNGIEVVDLSMSGCNGSFRVIGGAPELIGGTYTIDIRLTTDPSIAASSVTANVGHDGLVNFEVPQPGNYRISVRDEKACPAEAIVNMSGCDAVVFSFPFENHPPGASFCVPVTVAGFQAVSGFQYAINFDPSVLSFTGVQINNPNIPMLTAGAFNGPPSSGGNQPPGVIRVQYADFSGATVTLGDGEVLYELCFTAIAPLGNCSPLEFTDMPVPVVVTIETPNGAETSGFTLNQGTICISNDAFFVGLTQDSLSCADAMDGRLSIVAAGGISPYSVRYRRITPPITGFFGPDLIAGSPAMISYPGLRAGRYVVEVTDAAMNIVNDTIDVEAPSGISLSILQTEPLCFGDMNGEVVGVVRVNNTPITDPVGAGYSFSWNISSANVDRLTGLSSNIPVSLQITSPRGCQAIASVTLGGPDPLRISPQDDELATTSATCAGALNGAITVSGIGGVPGPTGYNFVWSTGDTNNSLTDVTLSNLDPGTYTVTLTDENGCTEIASYRVAASKTLSVNAIVENILCNGDDNGRIFATGVTTINDPNTTPDLPYTFNWSTNAPVPVETNTTTQISNLGPGIYNLTLTDNSGCEIDTAFTIQEPAVLAISAINTLGESCTVGLDGSATLVVAGGTLPYAYTWSHSAMETDSIANNLTAMVGYQVRVTDANGCTVDGTFDILSPTPPQIILFNDDFVSCPDATDGSLSVQASAGGSPIVQYQWGDSNGNTLGVGPTTTTISNLSPGTYYVTITGQDACTVVDSAQVLSPGLVVIDSVRYTSPTCVGDSDGRIQLFPSGGTAPYFFTWSTNPNVPGTINPLTGLAAATYSVTITDANGCTPSVQSLTLAEPPSIVATFTNLVGVSCPDDATCDGQATISAIYSDGSNGSFNFSWSEGTVALGLSSSSISQLCRGPISVSISDGACGATFTDIIPTPPNITAGIEIVPVACFGDSNGSITVSPSGGTGSFSFFWPANGATTSTVSGLTAGLYTVILTDANGCNRPQLIELNEPDPLVLAIDPVQSRPTVTCAGDRDGQIGVFVSSTNNNPLLPAPFTWSGGAAGPTQTMATGLAPGTYSVTVTDTRGCTDEVSYTITEPTPITFSVLPIEEPFCFGETTLVTIDTAFGGSSQRFDDFTFSVNNNGFRIPVLQAGTTFAGQTVVTVFDTVGCSASDTFSVNQPPAILVNLPAQLVIELGDSLTILNPIISPAGDLYTYLWTPAEFLSSDTVRSPGIYPFESRTYTLTVTNANGCMASAEIFVEVDVNRNVYIPNVFSPNRDGRNEDFRIYACQGVERVTTVRIFDRWGGMMFSADNLDPNCLDGIVLWDGLYKGKPVNPGVFVYMIEVLFLDGTRLLYRGDISVLR